MHPLQCIKYLILSNQSLPCDPNSAMQTRSKSKQAATLVLESIPTAESLAPLKLDTLSSFLAAWFYYTVIGISHGMFAFVMFVVYGCFEFDFWKSWMIAYACSCIASSQLDFAKKVMGKEDRREAVVNVKFGGGE